MMKTVNKSEMSFQFLWFESSAFQSRNLLCQQQDLRFRLYSMLKEISNFPAKPTANEDVEK